MPQSFRNRKYTAGLVADIGKTALMTDSNVGGGDGGGKAAGQGEGTLQRMPRTQRRKLHVTEAARPRIGAAWVPNTPKADYV